jgi:predicted HTH transcriptional regulator
MSWLTDIAKKTQDIPVASKLHDRLSRKPSKYTDAERDELLVKIEILTAQNSKLQNAENVETTQQEGQLAEEEIAILNTLAYEDEASAHQIAKAFNFSLARAHYHLKRLTELEYLASNTVLERQGYFLDQRGREYLAANNPD